MTPEKLIPKRYISYHVEFYGRNSQGLLTLLGGLSMTIAFEHNPDRLKFAFRRLNDNNVLDKAVQVKFFEYGRLSA